MKSFSLPDAVRGIQIEKDAAKAARDMPEMHSHQFNELYFLISGERRYFIGHTIYDVLPDNVIIIQKNELHKTNTRNNKGYERYVVYFSDEDISQLENHKNSSSVLSESGCISLPHKIAEVIKAKLDEIYNEESHTDSYSEAMTKSIFCEIMILIMRYGTKASGASDIHSDKIQEVARYISENFEKEISLSDAAKMAYMEETYFSKKFKRLTGFGFSEYLCETRLNEAARLLIYTDLSISEISDKCGFSSSNYFGDVFKRLNGVSPSAYRKNKH